jgi:hypothetical protein
LKEATERPR